MELVQQWAKQWQVIFIRMIYSNREIHDILSGVANVFLVLGGILLAIHFVAPLIGGKFLISALVLYGSWIAFALSMRYEAKRIKSNGKIKGNEYLYISILGTGCMLLWFPFPYSIIAGLLFSFSRYMLYKKQVGQEAIQNNN